MPSRNRNKTGVFRAGRHGKSRLWQSPKPSDRLLTIPVYCGSVVSRKRINCPLNRYLRCTIESVIEQESIFNLAITHLREGKADLAATVCAEALRKYPDDANILCLAGQSLLALHRINDARVPIERASTRHPKFPVAQESLGDLLLAECRYEDAIQTYQKVLQLAPGRPNIQAKIDRAQHLVQASGPSAVGRRSTMAFAEEIARAAQLENEGKHNQSEKIYRDILKRDPNHVEAMRLLAVIAKAHKEYRDAEILLSRAVLRAPDYARAWLELCTVQLELEKHTEAIESAAEVVKLTPNMAEPHIALANAQARANFTEQAIESYRAALNIAPKHPGAFSGLGHQLKTIGKQQEAIEAHRANIAANPSNTEPYWNLANMKTFRFETEEITAMEALLKENTLDEQGVSHLCNALGLDCEGRKDYPRAFQYFERCNLARRQTENYDPVRNEVVTEKIKTIFSEEFVHQHQDHGERDSSPIFIVGLPRSGSTLIEQILASHSTVEGTHELNDLDSIVHNITRTQASNDVFPDTLNNLGKGAWAKIGEQYLSSTQKYRSGMPVFIDKNPNNFIYAGLLHLALPNAKIINARRHPLDSCFGSYKQLFASGQPFTYDLTEIGEYYLQYQSLMDHWHQVIPGKVLDVDYENVVNDLETQVRRILAFCQLPFEETCLRFHETDRAVKTASSEQVRKPIYSSSVNLWKHYESDLEELIEVLEPLLENLPPENRPVSLDRS